MTDVIMRPLPLYPAQVFPGELHLESLEFEREMEDRSSAIFQDTANKISAAVSCGYMKHVALLPLGLFIHLFGVGY